MELIYSRFQGPSLAFTVLFLIFVTIVFIEGARAVFLAKGKLERIGKERVTFIPLVSYIMIIAGGIGEYFIAGRQIRFIVSFSGVAVFIIGVSLRNLSIRTLGTSWSIHVCADNVERIVKKGPYRYIRHPYYLGSLFILLGLLLASNSYYSILLIFLLQVPLYLIRIALEEKELVRKFGEEYVIYKRGAWI